MCRGGSAASRQQACIAVTGGKLRWSLFPRHLYLLTDLVRSRKQREGGCGMGLSPAAAAAIYAAFNCFSATAIVFANKSGEWGRQGITKRGRPASLPPLEADRILSRPADCSTVPDRERARRTAGSPVPPSAAFAGGTQPNFQPPFASSSTTCAVFSIFNFHFTYALTLVHTVVTLFGMQLFLRVRRISCAGASSCLPLCSLTGYEAP